MPSLRARLVGPLLLPMREWQSRLARRGPDAIARFSARADRMAPRARIPAGVARLPAVEGGVAGEWLVPDQAREDAVIIFVHGGGLFFGLTAAHREAAAHLAAATGRRAFAVDYRLMPGHQYPAAHDDCAAAHRAIAHSTRTVLVGESTGGVLSLATMLRARSAGEPLPSLFVGISPTADFAFDADPAFGEAGDPFTSPSFVKLMHRRYVAGADLAAPDLSPVAAGLEGLPPMLIHLAERDLLRDHAARLAAAAEHAGVAVEVRSWPGVWHGWHLMPGLIPEAGAAIEEIAAGIDRHLARLAGA